MYAGVWPALVTPFRPDGSVDEPALAELVAFVLAHGSVGLVVTGTLGEAGSLTRDERRRVTQLVADRAADVPVMAGISSDTPAQAIEFARDAAVSGATALMCLPPVTYDADDNELLHFFRAIADASDLPIILYNSPHASRTDLHPERVARLFDEIEGVQGIKECSGDARRIAAIGALTEGRMAVIVGGDDWALEGFCAGATGWISGCANVVPRECTELYALCTAGRLEDARRIYERLLPLARLDMTPKLVQYFKAAIEQIGMSAGPCRPPRLALTDDELDTVAAAVAHACAGTSQPDEMVAVRTNS